MPVVITICIPEELSYKIGPQLIKIGTASYSAASLLKYTLDVIPYKGLHIGLQNVPIGERCRIMGKAGSIVPYIQAVAYLGPVPEVSDEIRGGTIRPLDLPGLIITGSKEWVKQDSMEHRRTHTFLRGRIYFGAGRLY